MIKFRAWDKFKEIMYVVEAIDFIENEISVRDEDFPECFKTLPLDSSVILMQSTGLFDKNGKEIFEGDILSTDLERPYLVVERHNTYFLYQCNDGKEDYYDTMLSVREKHIKQDMTVEIIGNIHENPELLEVDHE